MPIDIKYDEQNNNWRMQDPNGYIRIYGDKPNPKNWNQFYYEHRQVIENTLKRKLQEGEMIHHIDKNRANNSPENLKLVADKARHVREEHPEWIKTKHIPRFGGSMNKIGSAEFMADVIQRVLEKLDAGGPIIKPGQNLGVKKLTAIHGGNAGMAQHEAEFKKALNESDFGVPGAKANAAEPKKKKDSWWPF